ncbi:MAG: MarR family winged helix-turn-helix transcriptional regulator [Clostridia bacterium]
MRPRSSTTDGAPIRALLSYRLHQVANLLSRGAELRYRRLFGVSLWEWRTIALLGGSPKPLSLNELARSAGIHKSQMSRVVSGLARRGLVLREADAADGRGVRLALGKAGRRVYEGLIRAAAQRDAAFRDCLSEKERAVFDRALAKLADEARRLIHEERAA